MRYKYNPRIKNNSSAGGLSKVDEFYQVFHRVRARCDYKGNKDYCRYGGRGIKFLWKDYLSFKNDMYESYIEHKKHNPSTTLERIDNNGHYSKQNCCWATWSEQAKNKRTSRYLTYRGKTMIISDWAKELGCHRQTLRYRLESGWTPEQVIETQINHNNRLKK
jgi:hypothetical protein